MYESSKPMRIDFSQIKKEKKGIEKYVSKKSLKNVFYGFVLASALYGSGVFIESNKLSKSLNPLRNEYSKLIFSNLNEPNPDFSRKAREISDTRKRFSEDNGAFDRVWRSNNLGHYGDVNLSMPGPIAFDVRFWFKERDESSLDDYFNKE
jgi:hypothetical protein